jgi:hypothetical protein
MKKIYKKICFLVTAALLIVVLPGIAGCQSKNILTDISKTLEVDVSEGTVISETDDHGGFHGDGTTFVEISFSDNDCLNLIKESSAWKPFPLTDNMTAIIYGLGNSLIPNIQNGYYCFVDRHWESKDKKDDSEVLNRYSFNFTAAIYDTDANILYYMELDT